MPKNSVNSRLSNQAVGSAGFMGANYREVNDALGDKGFLHRMRIARKENKDCLHWLELVEEANLEFKLRMKELKQECREIKSIFSTIINKKEDKNKVN